MPPRGEPCWSAARTSQVERASRCRATKVAVPARGQPGRLATPFPSPSFPLVSLRPCSRCGRGFPGCVTRRGGVGSGDSEDGLGRRALRGVENLKGHPRGQLPMGVGVGRPAVPAAGSHRSCGLHGSSSARLVRSAGRVGLTPSDLPGPTCRKSRLGRPGHGEKRVKPRPGAGRGSEGCIGVNQQDSEDAQARRLA